MSQFSDLVTDKPPYRNAILPDGNFIAEGGAGELFLSKIE
jgi:hypothetical protein